jgi:hypothetical protein
MRDAGFDVSFRDCPAKGGTGGHPSRRITNEDIVLKLHDILLKDGANIQLQTHSHNVRFQVLMVVSMKMTAFWDTALCSLVEIYQHRGWRHFIVNGDHNWNNKVLDTFSVLVYVLMCTLYLLKLFYSLKILHL